MEDQVHSLIQNSGLTRINDDIMSLLRHAISIKTSPFGTTEPPLGISRIGGLPDLPSQIDWPEWDDRHIPLIAQIRLADLVPYDQSDELPHKGLLYFFFDEEAFDTYPPASGSWRVLYYDGDSADLQRRLVPSDEPLIYPGCAITFSPRQTLPPLESLYLERAGFSYDAYHSDAPPEKKKEVDAYIKLTEQIEEFYGKTASYHQILGYPYQIQGDLLLECQQGTQYQGDPTDWRLLLQIDSDKNAHMMWGDVGALYFYISQQALLDHDFSQVHLLMQCC